MNTRQQIADAEWANVERDAMLCLDDLCDHGGLVAADEAGAVRAYIEGLKARHERALLAVRAELDAARQRAGKFAADLADMSEAACDLETAAVEASRQMFAPCTGCPDDVPPCAKCKAGAALAVALRMDGMRDE